MMPSIVYPMAAFYRKQWGVWDALRECVWQEFLDLFKGNWVIEHQNGTAIIEGQGAHMKLRDLLLGVSNKDDTQIGQFGEGTKLGWLVLLREGIPFKLTSGTFHNLHARWTDLYGEKVMEIIWDEGEFFNGSRYELEYDGPLYEERIVRPDDERIVWQDEGCRRAILMEREPGFYIKGIWISPAEIYQDGCAFGYVLNDVKLAEDRQIADTWSLRTEIGDIWMKVNKPELLVQFYQAVSDKRGEGRAYTVSGLCVDKAAHRQAFRQVYGSRAVIATDAQAQQEASYRGLELVMAPSGMSETLKTIVGTDREVLAKLAGQGFTSIPRKQLNKEQLWTLRLLQRLARRAGVNKKIMPCLLPANAKGQVYNGTIAIDMSVLDDHIDAVATLLHELAHLLKNTEDATAAHVDAVSEVGAQIIASYAVR